MDSTLQSSIMLAALEGDLQRLLALGRDGLGCPLLLGDDTLHVLGWSGPPDLRPDASWEDFIQAGLAPDFQWSDDLLQANSLDLPHGFSVCQVPRPAGGAHWLVDIDGNEGQPLHLIVSGRDRAASGPPDGELLSLVCLAARSCVNNRSDSGPYRRFSSEQLLLQLIRNQLPDEPVLRYRAQAVHMDSEGYFALLMMDLRGYHPQRNSIATIRSQLSATLEGHSVIDGETLTFLVCHESDDPERQRQTWARVERLLDENDLFGVYSRPFYRLGDLHYHYAHTLDALKLRFCAQPDRCLAASEDLALYSLIASTREAGGPDLPPHPVIRILQQSDQQRKTAYVETLFAYLAHSQKPIPTCGALHIHRNTLDYRLRRIEELTDLDWGDGDLMFRLYFSLCSLRYDQLAVTLPPVP
jgi:sugar diacid utilization regulator